MTPEDLDELLAELREGGMQESTAVEFKRCWYDLKLSPQQDEFIRDITALANAHTNDRRVIIFGLKPDGTTEAAPLPEDESRLQDRLKRITPTPTVSFKNVAISGGPTLSVAEVHPPLDPPYVAQIKDQHQIFVRSGSRTITASRNALDRWYREAKKPPQLSLLVDGEEVEDGQTIVVERELHVAEKSAPRGFVALPMYPREPDPEEVADYENHRFTLYIAVQNDGSSPAENLVADFEISGVRELNLYEAYADPLGLAIPVRHTWATDPNENAYVDDRSVEDGVATVRQRIRRVNPGVDESFVRLLLLATKVPLGQPIVFQVMYRVTEGTGVQLRGQFSVQIKFSGTKPIRRKSDASFGGV